MLTHLLFPGLRGLRVDRIRWLAGVLHVDLATVGRSARCPLCGRCSRQVRSRYQRTLADLPCGGAALVLHLQTRRFACRVPWCRRRIFTERLPGLVAPAARRTERLRAHLAIIGLALGGEAGARHATASATPVSASTLLRLVRARPLAPVPAVRILGVDDFALRRGHTYGTVLVDLEQHRLIDVLPDRTAATLASWLRQHPEVEVISRDRAGAYAEGARLGAPQARQVADRFHLCKNVTDALERYLARHHSALRQAACPPTAPPAAAATLIAELPPDPAPAARLPAVGCSTREWQAQQARRAARLARYEQVVQLHRAGHSARAIAQQVGLSRGTVHHFLAAGTFPERQPRTGRHGLLAPFLAYLRERWAAGCHNATQLWHELQHRGFCGGRAMVARAVQDWRPVPTRCRAGARGPRAARASGAGTAADTAYSSRQTCWLLLRPAEELTEEERTFLTRLLQICPQVALMQALVQEFRTLLNQRDLAGLYNWLLGVDLAGIPELVGVARGIWRDRAAVEAAVTTNHSNGQVEGFVNKVKTCKRCMFGRANFDLLRCRLLAPA